MLEGGYRYWELEPDIDLEKCLRYDQSGNSPGLLKTEQGDIIRKLKNLPSTLI